MFVYNLYLKLTKKYIEYFAINLLKMNYSSLSGRIYTLFLEKRRSVYLIVCSQHGERTASANFNCLFALRLVNK